MPPITRKSKIFGVENHGMVLRKHRQSSIVSPTSQRKPLNEIGNVVRKYDTRASISIHLLKEEEKTVEPKISPISRKPRASRSTMRQSIVLKKVPLTADCNSVKRTCGSHQASSIQLSGRQSIEKSRNKLSEVTDIIRPMAPPLTAGLTKRKLSTVVPTKRLPRLTLKQPLNSPVIQTEDFICEEKLGIPLRGSAPQPPEIVQVPTPKSRFDAPNGGLPVKNTRRKKKNRLHINSKDDIDLMHQGCPWMMSAYASHIYLYLQELENKIPIGKPLCNLALVTEEIRANIVEWLGYIYHQLRLLQETYLLSVSILDRYLMGAQHIEKDKLQLVALICLCLAIKFEEAVPGSIKEMLKLTNDSYSKEQYLKMEADVIQVLDFQIGRPVSITFLRRYNLAARCDRIQHAYGKYLIDLAQLDKGLACERPSCLAAAAVFIGMCITKSEANSQRWNQVLRYYSSFDFTDIQPVVSRMATLAITGGGQHKSIRKRYSSEANYCVADKIERQLPILQKLR